MQLRYESQISFSRGKEIVTSVKESKFNWTFEEDLNKI